MHRGWHGENEIDRFTGARAAAFGPFGARAAARPTARVIARGHRSLLRLLAWRTGRGPRGVLAALRAKRRFINSSVRFDNCGIYPVIASSSCRFELLMTRQIPQLSQQAELLMERLFSHDAANTPCGPRPPSTSGCRGWGKEALEPQLRRWVSRRHGRNSYSS